MELPRIYLTMTKPKSSPVWRLDRFDPGEGHTFMSDNPMSVWPALMSVIKRPVTLSQLSPENTGATNKETSHKKQTISSIIVQNTQIPDYIIYIINNKHSLNRRLHVS